MAPIDAHQTQTHPGHPFAFWVPPFTILGCLISLLVHTGCGNQPDRPNVLLLTLDTLRADALGCYGNRTVQTPNLDRLAREGVLFEDTVCQIPATLSSHTAIHTGRNPKTSGVRFRTTHVPDFEETLAERFKAYGYRTTAFISSYVLAPEFGLNQGFDTYEMGSMIREGQKSAPERRAEETIDQAIAYLQSLKEKPFFLWVHLYDPHSPYDAPGPYSTMYDPDYSGSLRGSVAEITRLTTAQGQGTSSRDLQHLRALYDGEVAYMDHHIGRLLKVLEEQHLLDHTIIAALADHGEELGEHGRFFHGETLYQSAVHIPFLMRYPAEIPAGLRIPMLSQSIDLFPTLLELTSIPSVMGVDGKSLLPELKKTNGPSHDPSQLAYLETEADPLTECNKLFGLRTLDHKFIFHSAHRRNETPLGVYTEIPLKGPAVIFLRIQGDPAIRLMVHVRYRTRELYQSRNLQAVAALNSTVINAECMGSDLLQTEITQQDSFFPTPEGWRLQMTPDLYRLARHYGETQGWPVNWMMIEGVGVDASIPKKQSAATFTVDQIELYQPSLRFPNTHQYRDPFWVIEDFETSAGLIDAGEGDPHQIQSSWVNEERFGGKRQEKITITFTNPIDPDALDELFQIPQDMEENHNKLQETPVNSDALKTAHQCRTVLESWISRKPGEAEIQPLQTNQVEALETLGYVK